MCYNLSTKTNKGEKEMKLNQCVDVKITDVDFESV